MKKSLALLVLLALASLLSQHPWLWKGRNPFWPLSQPQQETKPYFPKGSTPTVADVLKLYRRLGLESLASELEPACLPCVNLVPSDEEFPPGYKPGRSKLGGLPALPHPALWPQYKGKPLAFVAQVSLDELPRDAVPSPLPDRGLLLVFYDAEQSVAGFEPGDRGGWRVLYVDTLPAELPAIAFPADLPEEARYKEVSMIPKPAVSMPDPDKTAMRLPLTDAQREEASDIYSQFIEHGVKHQILGHASPIQDDEMQLHCQLASHGIDCSDGKASKDPLVDAMKPGAANWILLLQVDSDDKANMMWGDSGRLYFWITRDDLKNRRFDNVWMVMQCY
jgi:uncharacterized protein YwqG